MFKLHRYKSAECTILGKLYGIGVTERVKSCTDHQTGMEQCGCRSDRMCGSGVSFREYVREIHGETEIYI